MWNGGAGGEAFDRRSLEDAIRRAGVQDPRVLEAFRTVDRRQFVPSEYTGQADADEPVPIGHGQVTTQPSLIGRMIEALELSGRERVLEVGTGFGYATALLARLAGEVYSIERLHELATRARGNLERAGVQNVTVVVGDGTAGLPEHAPYQSIVVSAAAPAVPIALVQQLDENGRLVQPIGLGGNELVTAFRKREGQLIAAAELTGASFVPLISGGDR